MNSKNNYKDPALLSIGSMFETGKIKKMYTIATLSPTKISKALSINYGRYISKLSQPDKFNVGEIVKLAELIEIDPDKIMRVIYDEMNLKKKS